MRQCRLCLRSTTALVEGKGGLWFCSPQWETSCFEIAQRRLGVPAKRRREFRLSRPRPGVIPKRAA
jgi:hypothetical protein